MVANYLSEIKKCAGEHNVSSRNRMPRTSLPRVWSVEEQEVCFVVRDHRQQLAYVCFEDKPRRRSAALRRALTMIRLTTVLLTLGVSMATATTAIAQGQNECFYGSCNPEASWCRLLCGSDPQYQNVRSQWHHRHAKHHHAKHHHAKHHKEAH
jgi:cation transport ATPase